MALASFFPSHFLDNYSNFHHISQQSQSSSNKVLRWALFMKQNLIFFEFGLLGKFSFSFCKYMVWFGLTLFLPARVMWYPLPVGIGLRNYNSVLTQMCTLWSLNDVAASDPQKTNSQWQQPGKGAKLVVFPAQHKVSLWLDILLIWYFVMLEKYQETREVGFRQVSGGYLVAPLLIDHTVCCALCSPQDLYTMTLSKSNSVTPLG